MTDFEASRPDEIIGWAREQVGDTAATFRVDFDPDSFAAYAVQDTLLSIGVTLSWLGRDQGLFRASAGGFGRESLLGLLSEQLPGIYRHRQFYEADREQARDGSEWSVVASSLEFDGRSFPVIGSGGRLTITDADGAQNITSSARTNLTPESGSLQIDRLAQGLDSVLARRPPDAQIRAAVGYHEASYVRHQQRIALVLMVAFEPPPDADAETPFARSMHYLQLIEPNLEDQ